MAHLIELTPSKTYATRENAIKAVEKKYGPNNANLPGQDKRGPLTYFIYTHTDGRFFPVFIGDRAIHAMVHFDFNVVA